MARVCCGWLSSRNYRRLEFPMGKSSLGQQSIFKIQQEVQFIIVSLFVCVCSFASVFVCTGFGDHSRTYSNKIATTKGKEKPHSFIILAVGYCCRHTHKTVWTGYYDLSSTTTLHFKQELHQQLSVKQYMPIRPRPSKRTVSLRTHCGNHHLKYTTTQDPIMIMHHLKYMAALHKPIRTPLLPCTTF